VDPVSWLEHMAKGSPVLLLVGVALAMFLDSLALIGALLPGDLLLMIPAAAVGPAGAPIVVAGGVIGTVLGYTVSYMLGRWSGPAIRRSWLGRRFGSDRWMQAERLLRGPAGRTLAMVQFMPLLNYLIPLLAGTLQVPRKRFILLTATGALAYSSFYVSLGVLAGGAGERLDASTGRPLALLVASVVVTVLGFTVLTRMVRRMAEEEDPAPEGKVDAAPGNVADSMSC
jgi:membrane-associated protein